MLFLSCTDHYMVKSRYATITCHDSCCGGEVILKAQWQKNTSPSDKDTDEYVIPKTGIK